MKTTGQRFKTRSDTYQHIFFILPDFPPRDQFKKCFNKYCQNRHTTRNCVQLSKRISFTKKCSNETV